jgi:hypothetical protein
VVVWGSTALAGLRSRARGLEIPQCAEQWPHGPMGWGMTRSASYSFTISWHGKTFHKLEIQSADVSALSCVLPQSSVSPVSQQSPWITELRRSAAVFQLPFGSTIITHFYKVMSFNKYQLLNNLCSKFNLGKGDVTNRWPFQTSLLLTMCI